MHKVRDQQCGFVHSTKNNHNTNNKGHSQEEKGTISQII